MTTTAVDKMYRDFGDLVEYLDKGEEVSLRSFANDNFRKALLLAAASYFERRLTGDLVAFVSEIAGDNNLVVAFCRNKGVHRQYHTYFDWESSNANQFFGLFGDDFKGFMKKQVRENDDLQRCMRSFLEVGRERNRLVHQDFGSFTLEKTAEEIYQLYRDALQFVDVIPVSLRRFAQLGGDV